MGAEEVLALILAPLLGAISTLFLLLHKERGLRLEDRDRTISELEKELRFYRERVVPNQEKLAESQMKMASVLEELKTLLVDEERPG